MKNIIKKLDSKLVADFKITEAFILDNELYITSIWQIPFEMYAELENKFTNNN